MVIAHLEFQLLGRLKIIQAYEFETILDNIGRLHFN
jgi:hypothetical protein